MKIKLDLFLSSFNSLKLVIGYCHLLKQVGYRKLQFCREDFSELFFKTIVSGALNTLNTQA